MSTNTPPFPTRLDPLEQERWLVTALLETALRDAHNPHLALMLVLVTLLKRRMSGLRHRGDAAAEQQVNLPDAYLQVCHEILGRPLAREELEFGAEMYRSNLKPEDQMLENRTIRRLLPGLPRLKDTGASDLWEVLGDSQD